MEVLTSNLSLRSTHERTSARSVTVQALSDSRTSAQPASPEHTQQLSSPSIERLQQSDNETPEWMKFQVNYSHHDKADPSSYVQVEAEDPDLRLIRMILEQLSGKKISTPGVEIQPAGHDTVISLGVLQNNSPQTQPQHSSDQPVVVPETTVIESVTETNSFTAEGTIRLADGREIAIDLKDFSRSEYRLDVSARFQDPLVFQMNNGDIELTGERLSFDLDADGEEENVYFVTGNSKFLAFDQNLNGRIDNGAELFGALSGDGYQELAQFDEDGNGFIDEGDSIYEQLVLFSRDSEGADQLISIQNAGIGAIYLDRVASPRGLEKNSELAGQVRATSIYLMENGGVGKTHQIDLVV